MNWICRPWNTINSAPLVGVPACSRLPSSRLFVVCIFGLLQVSDKTACQELQKTPDYCNLTSTNVSTPDYFSPFYPNPYPNNSDCSKLITAPPDHIIELSFRGRFNIEGRDCHMLRSSYIPQRPIECYCQYDFLEVRDGPYGYSPLIGRFCGKIYPPSLRSTTRYMKLRFKSDDAIQYEGFYALHRFVPYERKRDMWNTTGCYIALSSPTEGLVNTSSIPKKFINDAQTNGVPLDCIFEITVPNATQILLRFTEIKLANPSDCDMDFIDVHRQSLDFHNRVRQYCGGHANHSHIDAPKAFLHFMSDPKKLDENSFSGFFTALKESSVCESGKDFDCGDGRCISADLVCNEKANCENNMDEVKCKAGLGYGKTTVQSIIISVVVGVIVLGVLAVAIYLTCNERQISQPRRYFAPAPLSKTATTDEFGYGCTVDEMFARSKEEELGYFVRRVQGPIVENIPVSKLVNSHSTTNFTESVPNGIDHTSSLPRNFIRPSRNHTARNHVNVSSPVVIRTRSQSPGISPGRSNHHKIRFLDAPVVNTEDQLDLNTSLRQGMPVFMYSPNTKKRLTRVA